MKPNKQTSTYFMPKCPACDRRYKIDKATCMKISFSSVDESGVYHRDTHYEAGDTFCRKCTAEFKRIGPRAFLNKVLKEFKPD